MQLNDRDIQQLAGFFAKRFPTYELREQLAGRARLSGVDLGNGNPHEGWELLLHQAHERGALERVAAVARQTDPSDENLNEVCDLLGGRPRPAWVVPAIATAVGLFVLGGTGVAGVAWMGMGSSEEPVAEAMAMNDTPLVASDASPLEDDDRDSPEGSPEGALAVEALAEAQSEAPAPATGRPARERKARAVPANDGGRCRAGDGEVVGYWYAGATPPGALGDVITVDYSVNVRASYPNVENGHDKRTPVRCFLAPGNRVRLSRAPIKVEGERYWVPLVTGDLLEY